MTGKRIGYVRVSTVDQNPERQLEGVELDKKFTEFASGTTTNRPQLTAMLDYAREDDKIFVHSMDRLARNVKDLRNLIDSLRKNRISIHFVKENLIFSEENNPMSNLLLMVMGAIAEFEHAIMSERQREGIAIAKRAGKFKGRSKALSKEKIEFLKEQLRTTRITKSKLALDMGISRMTLYQYIKKAAE